MDEVQRLILQIEGEAKLSRLNDELKKEKSLLLELAGAKAAGVPVDPVKVEQAAANMVRLNKQMQILMTSSGKGFNPMNRLALTYMLDDFVNTSGGFERKLASISNNIPQILAMFGGGAPWVAGVSLAATGILALVTHSDQLMKLWAGEGPKKVDAALDRIKKKAKEAADAYESAMSATDPVGKRRADALTGEIAGHADDFQEKLATAFLPGGGRDRLNKAAADRNKAIESTKKTGVNAEGKTVPIFDIGQQQEIIARANAEYAKKRNALMKGFTDKAKSLMQRIYNGDQAAWDQLIDMMEKNPDLFPDKLVQDILDAAPSEHDSKMSRKDWMTKKRHKEQEWLDRETAASVKHDDETEAIEEGEKKEANKKFDKFQKDAHERVVQREATRRQQQWMTDPQSAFVEQASDDFRSYWTAEEDAKREPGKFSRPTLDQIMPLADELAQATQVATESQFPIGRIRELEAKLRMVMKRISDLQAHGENGGFNMFPQTWP